MNKNEREGVPDYNLTAPSRDVVYFCRAGGLSALVVAILPCSLVPVEFVAVILKFGGCLLLR